MAKDKRNQQIWQEVLQRSAQLPDEKKRKIVETTIRLIASEGVDGVTFEAIGLAMKTTKANIKYHFGDKQDLIFTAASLVVVNAQAMTLSYVEGVETPEEKLLAMVNAAYDWYSQFPDHFRVWCLFFYFAALHQNYADFFVQTRLAGQNRLSLLLRALPKGPNGASPDLDYRRLGEQIQNIIYGQMIGLTGRPKELKLNRAEAAEMVATLLLAKGIKWSAQP